MLAAAGQTSLIVWLPRLLPAGNGWYLAVVILVYWLILAVVFAVLIGRQICNRLERPMQTLGEAPVVSLTVTSLLCCAAAR